MPPARTVLVVLAVLVGAVARADEDRNQGVPRPAVFPCKLGLETKWAALRTRLPGPATLHTLIQQDAAGENLVRWDEARHTSLWAGIDRLLAGEAKAVAALRKLKEAEARAALTVARPADDLGSVAALYRRHPWVHAVHAALAEAGEAELRRGHAGLAQRCFQDVLSHSADEPLRSRARVGLWLALAQDDPPALAASFRDTDPGALFAWMGGQLSARQIRQRLTVRADAPPAPPALTDLEHRELTVPPSAGWVDERPAPHEEGVLVAGPGLLAWYAGDSTRPAWAQQSAAVVSASVWGLIAPGPFAPVVDAGRVYTRWGVAPVEEQPRRDRRGWGYLPAGLAAFDARTGALVWSTARSTAWEGLAPVGAPALAEGRLYVLAVDRHRAFAPVSLVCLDPGRGAVVWKRELVDAQTVLYADASKRRRPRFWEIDVAHFGNAVTVAGGAVYCLTNMGVVVRCDARDGLVEWARTYPRDDGGAAFETLLRRQGAAPVVAGRRVLFVPRDALGAFALDRDTGELLWHNSEDAAMRVLGTAGDLLLLADGRRVAALDLATGKARWQRRFDESVDGRALLAGTSVYVGTAGRLYRLNAASGKVEEEAGWGKGGPLKHLALRGRILLGTAPGGP